MAKKIAAFVLAVLLLGGVAYTSSYLYSSREMEEQTRELEKRMAEHSSDLLLPEEQTAEQERKPASSDPAAVRPNPEEAAYVLVEEYGFVNIYLADRETVYEYTDIPIDSLPEDLQNEICTGKGLKGEQDLYDFLENYSS